MTTTTLKRTRSTEPPAAADDWSVSAIAARAQRLKNPSLDEIAGLFHRARLAASAADQALSDAQLHADRFYPDTPAVLGDASVVNWPRDDWGPTKRLAWNHWLEQCRLIDQACGVLAASRAVDEADQLEGRLGYRVLEQPIRSLDDGLEKLSVIIHLLGDGKSVPIEPLRALSAELAPLAAGEPGSPSHRRRSAG
jgi:hypothetical protein